MGSVRKASTATRQSRQTRHICQVDSTDSALDSPRQSPTIPDSPRQSDIT